MKRAPAILAVLVVQLAIAGWLVFNRETILATGDVVHLEAVPLDPRDPLRGEYVVLGYEAATVDVAAGEESFDFGDSAFVTLAPGEPFWTVERVSGTRPREGINLRAEVLSVAERRPDGQPGARLRLDFGIGAFFVPEGEGPVLERMRNDGRVSVDVAIAGDGTPVLKALRVDGEVAYEVGLF